MVSIIIDKSPRALERNMFAGAMCYVLSGLVVGSFYFLYIFVERFNK